MNLLVLEDEEPAARQLLDYLTAAGVGLPAPPVVRSVAKALHWLRENPMPDLIFSDIELLDGNVFALYAQFPVTCPIIFTTAYDQFLLPAFRGNGIAYLLKPFSLEQVQEALAKYRLLRQPAAAATLSPALLQELSQALRPRPAPHYRERLTVRQRQHLVLLNVADIAYVQADGGITFAVDGAGTRYPLTGTLSELEQQLDPARFGRLNRSELVNVAFVEKAEAYFNNRLTVHLRQPVGTMLTTSAAQTPEFRRWLEG